MSVLIPAEQRIICTSSTRPGSPFEGQQIYETDTKRSWTYNGSQWIPEGHHVYTNEAARDAAITSPTEGMMVYLTAPTVPAATGAITAVPTGVQTIYNGSVWVCVTPVGAYSNTTGTATNQTSYVTTLTGDGTAVSVTLVTGTSALIQMNGVGFHNNTGNITYLSFSVSGATTTAAADGNGVALNQGVTTYYQTFARAYVFTGLTAGTNTFTLSYKGQPGTWGWVGRNLTVQGIA